jgi:hypothetical protein
MEISELEYDLKRMKSFKKSDDDKYADKDDAFVRNFIIKFREFIRPLSAENRKEFEKVSKNFNKNLSRFIRTSETLLQEAEPIYDRIMHDDVRRRKSNWHKNK